MSLLFWAAAAYAYEESRKHDSGSGIIIIDRDPSESDAARKLAKQFADKKTDPDRRRAIVGLSCEPTNIWHRLMDNIDSPYNNVTLSEGVQIAGRHLIKVARDESDNVELRVAALKTISEIVGKCMPAKNLGFDGDTSLGTLPKALQKLAEDGSVNPDVREAAQNCQNHIVYLRDEQNHSRMENAARDFAASTSPDRHYSAKYYADQVRGEFYNTDARAKHMVGTLHTAIVQAKKYFLDAATDPNEPEMVRAGALKAMGVAIGYAIDAKAEDGAKFERGGLGKIWQRIQDSADTKDLADIIAKIDAVTEQDNSPVVKTAASLSLSLIRGAGNGETARRIIGHQLLGRSL